MIGTVQEGRYRVLRKLGEGGMGEVFLVEHVHLGRSEALKVLKDEIAGDPHFVSRFRREARATNRVQHPNIVSVYDFGRLADGRYFLAMEYVEGDRLDQVIEAGPMAVDRALRIGAQLARAAAHAHSLGVVHRDLKPSNLILVIHRGQSDVLKVLDFGMAKIIGPAPRDHGAVTLDGQMIGTAAYMAPEQFLEQEADARTDVYAIGCILHELVAGKPPFTGSPIKLMNQHLRVAPEPPSLQRSAGAIPPGYDEIVARCLAKRPDERFASAAELADALDRLAGAAIVRSPRTPRSTRLGMPAARPLRPVDDFAGDTEDTDSVTAPGGESGVHAARTEPLTREVAHEVSSALLQEIADVLLDIGGAEVQLVAGMAQLRDLCAQIARIRARADDVEARAAALEQSVRERQASLSFAVGELSFDSGAAAGADVAGQIAELERRLGELSAEFRREMAALDDQALALAAALHDVDEVRAATAAGVARVIAGSLERLAADPRAAKLRDRLATVASLLRIDLAG